MCFIASATNNSLHLLKRNNRITLPTFSCPMLFLLAFERSYFTPVLYWFIIFSTAVSMHLINKISSEHLSTVIPEVSGEKSV